MPGFSIRQTSAADIPLVLTLIREMATYERVPERVEADEARLRQFVYCPRPLATVFLIEEDDAPIGYAMVLPVYSSYVGLPSLYLEDLYLRGDARGKGYGKRAMAFLARHVKENGYQNLYWSVLDWNTLSIEFYERLSAAREQDRFHYSLSGVALDALARLD